MKHNKLLLALVLTGSLMAGCSSAPAETKKDTEPVQSETAKSDTKEKDTKKTEKSQKPASSTTKTETPAKSGSTTAKAPAKSSNATAQTPAKSDNSATTAPTTPSGNNSGNSGSAAQTQPSTQPATPAQTDTVVGVSDVLANPQAYVGKTITVEGQLPQGMVGDGKIVAYPAGYMPSGSAAEIAANQLELSGNIDEGNCVTDLTGVLEASGDGYVFDVQNLQVVEQFTAGAAGGAVE